VGWVGDFLEIGFPTGIKGKEKVWSGRGGEGEAEAWHHRQKRGD
jgi:hypothetical protein